MNKILVILTYKSDKNSKAPLFEQFQQNYELTKKENGNFKNELFEINLNRENNKIIIVIQTNDIKENTSCIQNIIQSYEISELIVTAHGGQINKEDFLAKTNILLFKHSDANIYPILKDLSSKQKPFDEIWRDLEKKKLSYLISQLLHIFLPLDIDMQALADKRITDKRKYLKEMLTDVEDSFFMNKFENARKGIEGITDENYRKKLDVLFGDKSSYIYNFLTLLDNLAALNKQKKEGLIEEDLQDTQCWNAVTSFHCWYCKFTKCILFFSLS